MHVPFVWHTGKSKTGKSYLMNSFMNPDADHPLSKPTDWVHGFGFTPTQKIRKAIWIWVQPHPKDSRQSLVVLQTEGLFDVKKGDGNQDMKLFSLAVLLSSCLLYNAKERLDDIITKQLKYLFILLPMLL